MFKVPHIVTFPKSIRVHLILSVVNHGVGGSTQTSATFEYAPLLAAKLSKTASFRINSGRNICCRFSVKFAIFFFVANICLPLYSQLKLGNIRLLVCTATVDSVKDTR